MDCQVFYWAYQNFESKIGYPNGYIFNVANLAEVTLQIFNAGLNVMLFHGTDGKTIVFVDDKRFTQR